MRDGKTFILRTGTVDRGVITSVLLADEYDIRNLQLPKSATVVDIGANIGVFSILVSSKAGRVFSYEPVKENFELLRKNIGLNALSRRITPFNLAVTENSADTVKIFLSGYNQAGHSIYGRGNRHEEARSTTLQEILDSNSIEICDFLKIDAEGAEYEILYSLPARYFKRIKIVFFEYHDKYCSGYIKGYKNYNRKDLKAYLEKQGYRVKVILDCLRAETSE